MSEHEHHHKDHHRQKEHSKKEIIDLVVGPSNSNHRHVACPGVHKVDAEPVNKQEAGWDDRFRVDVTKGSHFVIVRTDANAGWGQNLILRLRVRGNGQPVITPEKPKEEHKKGWEVIEGAATSIGVDSRGNAICCGTGGAICERAAGSTAWVKIDGTATQVARGADGSTWYVNSAHQIFKRQGTTWVSYPGGAASIAVGSDKEVVIISPTNEIFKWHEQKNGWDRIEGLAASASIAHDGSFYITSKTDEVFRRSGGGWAKCPAAGRLVAVADRHHVYLLSGDNKIFHSADEGATWQPIEGHLRHIAAAPGHLVGASPTSQLFHQWM